MNAQFSPEWRTLLAGTRFPSDISSLEEPSAGLLDWGRVVELAWQHRVAPILYSRLSGMKPMPIPQRNLDTLKRAYMATAARKALLFRGLQKILEALGEARIESIVLKGAALAETVYEDRALRPMNDIDLLVREGDLDRAEAELKKIGYLAAHDEATKRDLRGRHHHWVFRSTDPRLGDIPLELHWYLEPPGRPVRVPVDDLWRRSVACRIAGVPTRTLAPEDLLLHLCLHICRHRFGGGLRCLCDLAAAIQRFRDEIDWFRL